MGIASASDTIVGAKAMIEMPEHLGLIQRQVPLISAYKAIAL